MAEKSYWEYRLRSPDHGWHHKPFVFEETAYFALRSAAILLQQQNQDTQPVHHENVEVMRIELPLHWCVQHDHGSCVVRGRHGMPLGADGQKVLLPEARKLIGKEVRTLCGYYVWDVETIKLGLPSCDLCLNEMFERYLVDELIQRRRGRAEIFGISRTAAKLAKKHMQDNAGIQRVFWIPNDEEVRLVEITDQVPNSEEVKPFRFMADPPEIPYRSLVVLMHPDDWERRSALKWPEGMKWESAVEIAPKIHYTPNILRLARAALLQPIIREEAPEGLKRSKAQASYAPRLKKKKRHRKA